MNVGRLRVANAHRRDALGNLGPAQSEFPVARRGSGGERCSLSVGKRRARQKVMGTCWRWASLLLPGGLPAFAGLFRPHRGGRAESASRLSGPAAVETGRHRPARPGADGLRRRGAWSRSLRCGSDWSCRRCRPSSVSDLLWISAVLLSLFWWMQALAWSLPLLKVRSVVLLLVVVIHLLVGRAAADARGYCVIQGGNGESWRLCSLSAVPAAWIGLKLMRQGRWEGPSRIYHALEPPAAGAVRGRAPAIWLRVWGAILA